MRKAASGAGGPLLPPAEVALIGLGKMGVPMALRLAEAGFRVRGHDSSAAARARFPAASGVAVMEDAGEAVRGAPAIVTMLPDGKVVAAVVEAIRAGSLPAQSSST